MTDNEKTPSADASDEDVADEMKEIEENPPDKLEDWPEGPAKYKTMGGNEGESGYDEGPTSKLGPSGVRYYADGKVTVDGDEVENPDDFKSDPIPGGPTDPNAPKDPGFDEDREPSSQDGDGPQDRGNVESDRDDRDEDKVATAGGHPEGGTDRDD